MNWTSMELHQAHLNELQREAEKDRLAREAQTAETQTVNPVVGAAMVALGRQFVKLGTHLQAQYAHGEDVVQLAPAD